MQLRPYQQKLENNIYGAWAEGHTNVLGVAPTGAGKTVIFSEVIRKESGASCAVAHRQEIVGQISVALNRDRIRHKIIGPDKVVKLCVNLHMLDTGVSHYAPQAQAAVAGVDTLIRRKDLDDWADSVKLWVQDECHHVLRENKWGKAVDMFPNARGLGVTATPLRADGQGLGRRADGVFDYMVEGPTMAELIEQGYLCKYRIVAPPIGIDVTDISISKATGDYNPHQLRAAAHKSKIVGDVVDTYLKFAAGLRAIVFATDVKTAGDIAANFNARGVPAAVVSANTKDLERISLTAKLKSGELKVLCNVDLFGEGYDVPVLDVSIMARPTQSYGLFVQQFGRPLRTYEGKEFGMVIDHVGNCVRHGLPDNPPVWTLGRRESKRSQAPDDAIPLTACNFEGCYNVYERVLPVCPYCGFKPLPAFRSGPEFVDGDLTELDEAALARLRGAVREIDKDKEIYRQELANKHVPMIGQMGHVNRHVRNQESQQRLREGISWWAGYQNYLGRSHAESYRRFYHKFGIDVMSAQALKAVDSEELLRKINLEIVNVSR